MAASSGKQRWAGAVKQVTKSNFAAALQQLRTDVDSADIVAISCRKTGDSVASSRRHPWHRVLPIDTPEVAYLKARLAAESYEILQFAVCPFRLRGHKVLAYPYNFHLFPRDEINLIGPSYSFSCQTSFLTSMAQEGFDFNACIYDGISYLSRVQESMVKERNPIPQIQPISSCSSLSVADSIFMSRIKSRVVHWWNICKESSNTIDGDLIESLRKLISGTELYGSRPSMSISVCSDRQVQLVLQTVSHIHDDIVPLVVPDKPGGPKAVRIVLTSSEEDKNLLMTEIQNFENEQDLRVRGFREVIDVISSSNKPVIGYNCLHDFTFIHSKFIAPLPPTLFEFMCSLRLVFTNILDINHLSKEIGPLRKAKNLCAALSYLKRQFFVPIDIELPPEAAEENSNKAIHGNNVLQITYLFAALNALLKLNPDGQLPQGQNIMSIEDYSNIFYPICTSLQEPDDELNYLMEHAKKSSSDNLVFLWGFSQLISSKELKRELQQIHEVFMEDFELQLMDKTCAAIVFSRSGLAEALLKEMGSGKFCSDALLIKTSGLRAVGYDAYRKVCMSGLWEADLADSLENIIAGSTNSLSASSEKDSSEVYWGSESTINLSEL
ncbi:hypothetical protein OPV22_031037 [Ensete ventricosum]|uniref:Uncharacterized protein n=1 Tax=Ensete ventricosum TaxID=4639 RepID=A0AAV8NZ17_ENSVE|nr:hypothetical protein OPV22_031037 [Ensete ventricosum]